MTAGNPPARAMRPGVHFTPRQGWINDPHGLTFRKDRYHLFYQAVPSGLRWQPWCSWGHATSTDLLTWEELPPVLSPGDGDYGCWSGGIVTEPASVPTAMFYTSVSRPNLDHGAVRIARPLADDWQEWVKGKIVLATPRDPPVVVFRDPNVFWEIDHWRMIVGAGHPDGRASVLTYTSTDQTRWEFDGQLADSRTQPPSHRLQTLAWECPQLISVSNRHVLIVSVQVDGVGQYVAAAVGDYVKGSIQVETWDRLSFGPGHYAPCCFLDSDGQPCAIFWVRNISDVQQGWSGALSIPYRLSIVAGRLTLTPHPNLCEARPGGRQLHGFSWRPPIGKAVQLHIPSTRNQPVVDLIATPSHVTVATATATVNAPRWGADIWVLIDGPILEVDTGQSLVGLPIPAVADLALPSREISAWWP